MTHRANIQAQYTAPLMIYIENIHFKGVFVRRGIRGRGGIFASFFFLCRLLFHHLVLHIFSKEKENNESIFFDGKDFNFLREG